MRNQQLCQLLLVGFSFNINFSFHINFNITHCRKKSSVNEIFLLY